MGFLNHFVELQLFPFPSSDGIGADLIFLEETFQELCHPKISPLFPRGAMAARGNNSRESWKYKTLEEKEGGPRLRNQSGFVGLLAEYTGEQTVSKTASSPVDVSRALGFPRCF